jgi:hypothetical protein
LRTTGVPDVTVWPNNVVVVAYDGLASHVNAEKRMTLTNVAMDAIAFGVMRGEENKGASERCSSGK